MPDTNQRRFPMRFDKQVALVTGAGSGIGRALVQRCVAEGASVVAVDIVEAPLHVLVKELQEQGGKAVGCVANVASETDTQRMLDTASEAGLRGGTAGTPYTVSTHRVVGLTRSIAFFYGDRGIRCNAVCPGPVETNIGFGGGTPHEAGMAHVWKLIEATTVGQPAKPEQLAAAMAFLASDEASFLNGAIVPVDNGWLAG